MLEATWGFWESKGMLDWIKNWFARPVQEGDVKRVRRGFGRKAASVAGRFPVIREAAALFRLAADARVPLAAKAVAVLALLYFIAPLDLAPDAIPVAGLLDDAAVILAAVSILAPKLARYRPETEAEHVIPAEVIATR